MKEKAVFMRTCYRLDKSLGDQLIDSWQSSTALFDDGERTLLEKHGAAGPIYNQRHQLYGFYYEVKDKEKALGLGEGFDVQLREVGDGSFYMVVADTHYPAGKAFHSEMKALNELRGRFADFSAFAAATLGLETYFTTREGEDGDLVYEPVIALVGRDAHVYVSIPGGGDFKAPMDHKADITPQFNKVTPQEMKAACE